MSKLHRAFTLIELLIVMAILALLAAVSLANFQTTRIKALDAQRKSDLSTVAKSLEAYANDYQSYPLSSSNNEILCQGNTACGWGTPFTDGKTIYAAVLPKDPSGYSYEYVTTDQGKSYTLYAFLQNSNDPSIVSGLTATCGPATCNYKLTSSNIN